MLETDKDEGLLGLVTSSRAGLDLSFCIASVYTLSGLREW